MAGGCHLHAPDDDEVFDKIVQARAWSKGHASLPEPDLLPSVSRSRPSGASRSRSGSGSAPPHSGSTVDSNVRPSKRLKTSSEPLGSEEAARLDDEEAEQLRAAIEASLEDQKIGRRLWSPLLDDKTLRAFTASATSASATAIVDLTLMEDDEDQASTSVQPSRRLKRKHAFSIIDWRDDIIDVSEEA
ncbi:hypothetical protein LXA43DRAFT_1096030 [Ganoderma leucocontextum]|nr:hypothetical protein LXA43DRAFT_1096030 [Ganoderma leucocontextum]